MKCHLCTFMKYLRKTWSNSFLLSEKNKGNDPEADESNIQDFEPDDNAALLKDLSMIVSF